MGRAKKPKMLQNIIYKLIKTDCEEVSKLKGDKLAIKIAKKVAVQMLSDQQRLIYNTITKYVDKYPEGMPTNDVAYYTQLDPTSVSAQLGQIHKNTHLIVDVGEGRFRYWKLA